jgi:multiple sugar transport system substrate-binding protein
MKRFKFSVVLLCLILMIVAIGGCAKTEDTSRTDTTKPAETTEETDKEYKLSGKFNVLVIGEFAKDSIDPVTGTKITGWDSLVKPFEEQHEGLEIDFVEVPWTDVVQKLETSAQSGTIDVMHLPANINNRLGAKGLLEPLDKYIEEDESFNPEELYGNNLWNENAMVQLNGVHYGIPKSAYTFVILINTKLFDDWGVPYITDDSTYEEIVEAASKMTGKNPVTGKHNYGLFTPRGTELLRMLLTYYSKTPAYRTFWTPDDPYTADIADINFVYTSNNYNATVENFSVVEKFSYLCAFQRGVSFSPPEHQIGTRHL